MSQKTQNSAPRDHVKSSSGFNGKIIIVNATVNCSVMQSNMDCMDAYCEQL